MGLEIEKKIFSHEIRADLMQRNVLEFNYFWEEKKERLHFGCLLWDPCTLHKGKVDFAQRVCLENDFRVTIC